MKLAGDFARHRHATLSLLPRLVLLLLDDVSSGSIESVLFTPRCTSIVAANPPQIARHADGAGLHAVSFKTKAKAAIF
jgi:hypothetical protein